MATTTTTLLVGNSSKFLPRPCILFDWSGTISDDMLLTHASAKMIADQYGYVIENDAKTWANETLASASAGMASVSRGKLVNASDIEKYHELYVEMLKRNGMKPTPFGDIVNRLKSLAAFGDTLLGVVSAHPIVSLYGEATDFGLVPKVFDPCMLHGGVTSKKDFLRGFCASKEEVRSARNVVYVGDSASDILAAKNADMISVAVCGGYHTQAKLAATNPDLMYLSASDFIDDFIARKIAIKLMGEENGGGKC